MTVRRPSFALPSLILAACAGLGLTGIYAVPALSQAASSGTSALRGHDGNAPIDVESDRIEVQDRADRAIFIGNVHARQGDMTMDSARLTVAYAKNANAAGGDDIKVHRLDASGGVVLTSPSETARGQLAIYDVDQRLITMIGGVVLVQDGNVIRGGRLVMNLDTGRAVVDGSAVGGSGSAGTGGRVSGRFTVPQRNKNP